MVLSSPTLMMHGHTNLKIILMSCILAMYCFVTVYVIWFCIWLGTNKSWFLCEAMYHCLIYFFILFYPSYSVFCWSLCMQFFIDVFHIQHTIFIWIYGNKIYLKKNLHPPNYKINSPRGPLNTLGFLWRMAFRSSGIFCCWSTGGSVPA